jgi:hypothetical protein
MPTFIQPPTPDPNYRYPDTAQNLMRALLTIHEEQQQEARRQRLEQRQAELDKQATEEHARQVQRQTEADAIGKFKEQISLADLKRLLAGQTPMAAAPTATAAEEGASPLPADEAGPQPSEIMVPKRAAAPLAIPEALGGGKVDLPPVQYKEEAEAEERRKKAQVAADTLSQLGMKEELVQGIRAQAQATAKADDAPATREVNGRVMGWNPQTKKFDIDYGPSDSPEARAARADKAGEKAEAAAGAKSVAEAWAAGVAFPGTQKDRTAALVYMDAHPDEFPKDRRPRQLTPVQQDKVLDASASLDRITAVRDAYQKVKDKIGPINYALNELGVKMPGIAEDPDFVTFNTALRQLDNLDIKRITGAAMSDKEGDRLMKGMATGGLKPKDFEAALRIMETDADRTREITLYGKRLPKAPAAGTDGKGGTSTGVGKKTGKYTIVSVE